MALSIWTILQKNYWVEKIILSILKHFNKFCKLLLILESLKILKVIFTYLATFKNLVIFKTLFLYSSFKTGTEPNHYYVKKHFNKWR